MTEREQFEAWYAQDDQERSGDSVRMSAEFVASLRDGDAYVGGDHSALNKAWRGWQAKPDTPAPVAAIQFALDLGLEATVFLSLWNHGEFETIRREFPEAPPEVFEGADPLAGQ